MLLKYLANNNYGTAHTEIYNLTRAVIEYSNKTRELPSSTRALLAHSSTAVCSRASQSLASTYSVLNTRERLLSCATRGSRVHTTQIT